ncbi:YebC/PmpR family DNA-binding transcriptional regulator [Patescibacteria group bacterium]|nr:YebC/PmpR family DNA-binding transcriptional regulator [Patescibacteria group bacterium]
MSGHSKWSTIKRKKGVADAKRGQIFTKLAKMVTLAAREGGSDVEMNFKLKLAIDKAKQANMPSDNIKRAIERGSGVGKDVAQIEEVTYEIFGPEGSAMLVTCLTDNRNRALSELKGVFSKLGGALGSVAWMFEPKGLAVVKKKSGVDWESMQVEAIDYGAEDFGEEDDVVEFYSAIVDLKKLKDWLESRGLEIEAAELVNMPKNKVTVSDKDKKEKVINFIETLEELDDVDKVEMNVDFVD